MELTHSQRVILAIGGAFLIFIILLATGVIPGLRNALERPPEITLTIWGIQDQSIFQDNMIAYETLRSNVRVDYEEINSATYEKDLVNALAAGKGPDVVMFHNSWLPKHFNKLVPVKDSQLNLKTLQELFPTVVEQNFAPNGQIFALPLYIDTLALLYNQDTFDKNGIAVPPKDWLEFQNLIPKLRQKDASGQLAKPAAAIGGTNNTINRASDLF